MSELFLCSFPELHAALRPELTAWPACRRLWPGLPDSKGEAQSCHVPADYPFSPREAEQCLNDMRAMESAALSGVPLQALSYMQGDGRAARQAAEAADLRRFTRSGECTAPAQETQRQGRLRAQKVLLWAWLLEERVLELRGLAEACSGGSSALLAPVLEAGVAGMDSEDAAALGLLANPAMGALDVDESLLPPWRVLLDQAAVFLPEGAVLVISQRMAADITDAMAESMPEDTADLGAFAPEAAVAQADSASPLPAFFAPVDAAMAQAWEVPAGLVCRAVRLPVWRAVGRAAAVPACPQWNKEYYFCVAEAAE